MFLTHRTERHSLRWKCTPCLTFRGSAKLFFVCTKDGSLTFSSPGQLFRQTTCLLSNCQLRPRHLPLMSAWVPAVLSNKPLTLLKRWHFSSLFIKLPKEHLSWGANRRGTGEKCFSPGFPEPFLPGLLDISCFPEQPLKYQKNMIQQNRGPRKADTRCVKAWAGQTGMVRRVRIHHNCVQCIIKRICWREIFSDHTKSPRG